MTTFLRVIPRGQLLILVALVSAIAFTNASMKPVEAAVAPPTEQQVEPLGHWHCGGWIWRYGTTKHGGMMGGTSPSISIHWGLIHNKCGIIGQWASCRYTTTVIAVSGMSCGFYNSGGGWIDVWANWHECSSPLSGVGVCWPAYTRQRMWVGGTYTLYCNLPRPWTMHGIFSTGCTKV